MQIEALHKQLNEAQNQFRMIENFVEKYQPVRVQQQIADTLITFLGASELDKLKVFEH